MADAVKVTFGGKPVYSVRQTLSQMHVREHAKVDRFNRRARVELCNSFLNPLGQQPCKGWLLMKKKDIVALRTSASHTLKIEQPDGLPTVECNRLLITHAEAVFNAADGDEMLYVAEIADRRWYGHNPYYQLDFYGDAQKSVFNLLSGLFPGSAIGSTTPPEPGWYTWKKMFETLWPVWLSSSTATFPAKPTGDYWELYGPNSYSYLPDPHGYDFRGKTPYEAMGEVLDKFGFALSYNPASGRYEVAVLNSARNILDDDNEPLRQKYQKYLEDELHYYDPTIAIYPKGVSVNFNKVATQPGSEDTYNGGADWLSGMVHREAVDFTSNEREVSYTLDNTYAQLWDDLPAYVNPFTGTITNLAQVKFRAKERMRSFFRALNRRDDIELFGNAVHTEPSLRFRKAYGIAIPFSTREECRGVAWRSGSDDRWWTEIYNHPRFSLKVNDATGQFEHLPSTTRARPPILGPQLPTYPYEVFVGRVEGEPDADGWQTVVERRINPANNSVVDGVTFKAKDANA